MLKRASVASILACLFLVPRIGFAQADGRSIVVSSQRQATSVVPKSNGKVHIDHCQTCGPLFEGDASEGTWEWVRDPLQERRRTVRIYNLHCVRCHGVNGRGVWDIPDVPDFTDERWQMSRSDADLVRLTLGGRGACMPAFKGTVTRTEAFAIARYLRTFAQSPAERPTTKASAHLKSQADSFSTPAVTRRPMIRQRTNVASRTQVPPKSPTSKGPLSWINPFSKKQPSVKK